MKRSKADYNIQTVTNALRLLEAFQQGEEELGVTELARRLDLHKNNVFRLLATLEEKGYVEQQIGGDRYRLGVSCLLLGNAYCRNGLVASARPALQDLATRCGESAHLGTLDDFEVVHLDGIQPEQLLLSGLRVGARLPLHCSAVGKVLLAYAPPETREQFDRQVVAGGQLPARTDATISDRDKFFDHIGAVAAQGFALDLEECEVGLCCAAAPIHDATGRVVAALSVSGPSLRLSRERLHDEIVPRVVSAAQDVSRLLGYVDPTHTQ